MVQGHERQRKILQRMAESNTFPNALLLAGPPGIGKLTTVKEFILNLVVKNQGLQPEDYAHDWDSGNLTDIIKCVPEKKRFSVDEVREIKKQSYRPPSRSPLKWIILEDVETLSIEASNALLKVLEDTPPQTKFILLTNDESKVIHTIRGRCFKIDFYPLPDDEVAKYLEITERISEEEAYTAAMLADGSIERAVLYVSDSSYPRLMKTVCEWFQGWASSPLLDLWESIEDAFKEYDPDLIYTMMTNVLAEMWAIEKQIPAKNPYIEKEKMEKAVKQLSPKGLDYIQVRLNELKRIKTAMNASSQMKSLFLEMRPVK